MSVPLSVIPPVLLAMPRKACGETSWFAAEDFGIGLTDTLPVSML